MKIHSESRIPYPAALVYAAYRDRLPEVAPYIPDIGSITVVAREQTPGGVKLHNRWKADREIPAIVQRFLTPEMLCWDDYAEWFDAKRDCSWRLSIPALPDQVQCKGHNTFIEDGDQTRVVLTGELTIQADRVPGVPRILARRLAPQIEKFIVQLITPNLQKVNDSLGAFLDAQQG
ncbi:MAG: hypothetical protein ACI8S6_001147 [Myxococcota bacterium]|jgi:hypothetical protein